MDGPAAEGRAADDPFPRRAVEHQPLVFDGACDAGFWLRAEGNNGGGTGTLAGIDSFMKMLSLIHI